MLALYNKDFTTKYGAISSIIEAFVEEERNGLFELSFVMLNTDSLFKYIEEDNIVVANANNTLVNQKFRIYMTRKLMNNRVEVFARHISFDLMYDYIDNISFENQSCEYALNLLFKNSNFSSHYKGYSDIINAQNYNMSMANVLEAIGGKRGSILDTFGTGAELLRDNENIHVLNKRGHNNSVTIEYKKNLTGFELEEDTTDLVTRILPYAKYTPTDEEGNSQDEVVVKASFVDSPLIANYSHPFVKAIDYSEKFEEDDVPTIEKLLNLARKEYTNNKIDIPKQNFKIEFIPLSKCVGYEGLEDNISLCDTVTIKDTRYNIDTQAKVIKVIFNVLKNRYESMELGEPKTSLGDIIGSNDSTKGEKGDKGDKGDKGEDGSIGDFPNSLPATPIVTTKAYGFANIEISWTFENKVYYQYEVYASKEANFTPNTFNLIHSGQTSTYMFQAKPNETWYFKVCAINTHENRTDFGYAYATTVKIDDLSNYVEEMAIDEALIGTLSLDRGWIGELKGNYIDAKQLSVTNGNGERTLDIDSYGNVNLNVASLKISSSDVATKNEITDVINSNVQQLQSSISDTNNKVSTVEQGLSKASTGINKVLFEIFEREFEIGNDIITLEDLIGKTPIKTYLIDDFSMSDWGDTYLAKMSTHLYFDYDVTYTLTAMSDDGGSLYLNGTLIASLPSSIPIGVTLNFKQGWNKIVWVFNEYYGGDGCSFTPSIKTLAGLSNMSAYPISTDNEGLSIVNNKIVTTTNRVANIEVNMDSITQRVSSTETTLNSTTNKIDNLKVGGRNLLLNSKTPIFYANDLGFGGTGDVIIENGVSFRRIVPDLDKAANSYSWLKDILCLDYSFNSIIGKELTLSIDVRPSKDCYVGLQVQYVDNYTLCPGGVWTRIYITRTIPTDWNGACGLICGALGTTLDIKMIKLELGNKGSDWTPAPEDIQNQIDDTNNNLQNNYSTTTEMNSVIEQKANEIVSSVSKNYVTKSENEDKFTGLNYWLFERYTNTQLLGCGNGTYATKDALNNETLIEKKLVGGLPGYTSNLGDYYIGVYTVWMYFEEDATYNTDIITDDEGTVYLNDVEILRSPSCQITPMTVNFKKGLNKFVIMHGEGGGGDGVTLVNGIPGTYTYGACADVVTNKAITNMYSTKSEVIQTAEDITYKFTNSGGYNRIYNSKIKQTSNAYGFGSRKVDGSMLESGKTYTLSMNGRKMDINNTSYPVIYLYAGNWSFSVNVGTQSATDTTESITFTLPHGVDVNNLYIDCYHFPGSDIGESRVNWVSLTEGEVPQPWSPHPSEIYDGITTIDKDGIVVSNSNANTTTSMSANGFYINQNGSGDVFKVDSNGINLSQGNVTINKDGATFNSPNANTSTTIDANGLTVRNGSSPVLVANNDGIAISEGNIGINKNGITVISPNGKAITYMNPDGFYLNYEGSDVFKVDNSGVNINQGNIALNKNGVTIASPNVSTTTNVNANGFKISNYGSDVLKVDENGIDISQGIVRVNKEGIEINHSGQGVSKFTSECLAFYDSQGIPNIKVQDGGFNFYSANGINEFIGVLKPTNTGTSYINGLTLALSNVGDYYDVGYHNSYNAYNSVFKIIPNTQSSLGTRGVYFNSLPVVVNDTFTVYNDIKSNNIVGTGNDLGIWSQGSYGGVAINSSSGYFYPMTDGNISLGTPYNRFYGIHLHHAPTVYSDKRVKENIKYIEKDINKEGLNLIPSDDSINTFDMHNFVKDSLNLAIYDLKGGHKEENIKNKIGFIAQDLIESKVGNYIIDDSKEMLSYNLGDYISVLAGALQHEIKLRDMQIEELNTRISNLEKLILSKSKAKTKTK